MEMTLEDAAYCLSDKPNGCIGCKFNKQDEIDCRREALKMGEDAIKTLMKYKDDFEKIFLEDKNNDQSENT